MKKRTLALSALILTQALTQVTTPAFARDRVNDMQTIKLSSTALSIGGKAYRLEINLERPMDAEEGSEMMGVAELITESGSRPFIAGYEDGDGNMLFQRVVGDDGQEKYVGSYCSSSFTACEEFAQGEKFELIRENDAWRAKVVTTFTDSSGNGEMVMVNLEEIPMS